MNYSDKHKKNGQFMAGTARLLAERQPGQTFSQEQIADACGVHKRTIQYIEAKALRSLARGLQKACPDALDELSPGKREGFLKTLNRGVYERCGTALTHGNTRHDALPAKRFAPPVFRRASSMTQEQVAAHLRSQEAFPKQSFGEARDAAIARRAQKILAV